MAAQHTPGRWYPVGSWVEVEDEDIPDICACHPVDMGQGHLHRSDAEILANARLIAAAPYLLKALERFANIDKTTNSDLWAINASYCEAARAAIAAAKGE